MKERVSIRDVIALTSVVFCFLFFLLIAFSTRARTQDPVVVGLVPGLIAVLSQIFGYYYGSSKKQTDADKAEVEKDIRNT